MANLRSGEREAFWRGEVASHTPSGLSVRRSVRSGAQRAVVLCLAADAARAGSSSCAGISAGGGRTAGERVTN